MIQPQCSRSKYRFQWRSDCSVHICWPHAAAFFFNVGGLNWKVTAPTTFCEQLSENPTRVLFCFFLKIDSCFAITAVACQSLCAISPVNIHLLFKHLQRVFSLLKERGRQIFNLVKNATQYFLLLMKTAPFVAVLGFVSISGGKSDTWSCRGQRRTQRPIVNVLRELTDSERSACDGITQVACEHHQAPRFSFSVNRILLKSPVSRLWPSYSCFFVCYSVCFVTDWFRNSRLILIPVLKSTNLADSWYWCLCCCLSPLKQWDQHKFSPTN